MLSYKTPAAIVRDNAAGAELAKAGMEFQNGRPQSPEGAAKAIDGAIRGAHPRRATETPTEFLRRVGYLPWT